MGRPLAGCPVRFIRRGRGRLHGVQPAFFAGHRGKYAGKRQWWAGGKCAILKMAGQGRG